MVRSKSDTTPGGADVVILEAAFCALRPSPADRKGRVMVMMELRGGGHR